MEKEPLREMYLIADGEYFDAELHILGLIVQAIRRHIPTDIEAQRRIANWLSSKTKNIQVHE